MAENSVIPLHPRTPTQMSPAALGDFIVRTRARFRELDHADWDGIRGRYQMTDTEKWTRAAQETAPAGWAEYVRVLAQGWDYYGGPDLPGEGRA